MNAVRLLFCIYNFIFLVIGGALLGVGIWIATDDSFSGKLKDLVDHIDTIGEGKETLINLISQGGFVLIGFGSLIFLLSFLGYCGAVKESRFLLGFYTLLLGIIFILELVAVVLILTIFGPRLEEETRNILVDNVDLKFKTVEDGISREGFAGTLNGIMVEFKCCGINDGADFAEYRAGTQFKVPPACCIPGSQIDIQTCQLNPTDSNSYIQHGCYYNLKNEIVTQGRKTTAIVVGVILGLLQLLGIIFAIFTYKKAYSYG
jgi:hypothetical protein